VPARLHHERIARTGTAPAHWLVMTHGMFGAGSNWRGIARKVNDQRPEWGIVLVDLRQHGRSEAGDPPHTIAACAEDLAALCSELPVRAIAGHSFGGKVALATRARIDLAQTWMLDASPSARPEALADPDNSVMRVLALMQRLPASWPSREAFVAAVTAEGHDAAFAQWLAMNLVPGDGGLINRLDLPALRALLGDYYAVDLWDAVLTPRGALEVVVAIRSSTLSTSDRARLDAAPSHVHRHDIDAGHWLHIEAPAQVVELFSRHLP
jgi:esterase